MTPAELQALVEASDERERTAWLRAAWFTSLLLAPHLKRGRSLSPERLLPESMRQHKTPRSKDEARRELKDLKRELKVD